MSILAHLRERWGRGQPGDPGHAVAKTPFLDIVSVLIAHGIAAQDIPAKLERLALVPDVVIDGARRHTLWVSNDNDFLATVVDTRHPTGIDNPNKFFVFAIDPALVPGFERQRLFGL
jgi:hypothetical protein